MDCDEVIRQMMSDLGNDRRDYLSAPVERHHDRREEVNTLARAEETRRSRQNQNDPVLRAWNDESFFERDEVAAQLENRMDGQGHRARLNRSHHYDEHREMQENRVGEERARYLQERAVQGTSNYNAHDLASPANYRAVRQPASLNHMPRSPGRDLLRSMDRGDRGVPRRAAPSSSRATNRNRAPSPGAAGTVRFQHDQRVVRDGRAEVAMPSTASPARDQAVLNATSGLRLTPAAMNMSGTALSPTPAARGESYATSSLKLQPTSLTHRVPPAKSVPQMSTLQRAQAALRATDAAIIRPEQSTQRETVTGHARTRMSSTPSSGATVPATVTYAAIPAAQKHCSQSTEPVVAQLPVPSSSSASGAIGDISPDAQNRFTPAPLVHGTKPTIASRPLQAASTKDGTCPRPDTISISAAGLSQEACTEDMDDPNARHGILSAQDHSTVVLNQAADYHNAVDVDEQSGALHSQRHETVEHHQGVTAVADTSASGVRDFVPHANTPFELQSVTKPSPSSKAVEMDSPSIPRVASPFITVAMTQNAGIGPGLIVHDVSSTYAENGSDVSTIDSHANDLHPTAASVACGWLSFLFVDVVGNHILGVGQALAVPIRASINFTFEEGNLAPHELFQMVERFTSDFNERVIAPSCSVSANGAIADDDEEL